MKDLLLAIDVGTQSARALLFDPAGTVQAKAQVHFDPVYDAPGPGLAERDPDGYWAAVGEACAALWSGGADPSRVAGLSLTTQRATVVCLDRDGAVLRPAILWLDRRRATRLPGGHGLAVARRLPVVGPVLAHLQREAEANWLAEHEPELWARTAHFLFLSGFLHWRLTGAFVDATACQVGYMPFDYRTGQWARAGDLKWKAMSIRREQLPDLVPPGERIGTLCAQAASTLGLPEGTPVIASGADKACEVLGSGATTPDAAALSFGTTATINSTQPRYLEVQPPLPPYPAAQPGAWNTEIQIYRGFWMVSWFKREFAQRERSLAAERGVPPESLFDELLRAAPPGAMGLTLQPYWSPGVRDPGPEAKGAIIGFGDVHTRAHLYRAIIEGLAYGLRAGGEQIQRRSGVPFSRVVVSGGGSQSDGAMQITADVFGLPAERPEVTETSALGAAINAAVGLGLHRDHATAVEAMTRPGRTFTPEPDAVATYDALYRQVYRKMYGRLRPLYRRIRAITGYPP